MYKPGTILYFNPFYFKSGSKDRKYFIVLNNIDNKIIIATLPSSIAHIPTNMQGLHGCIDQPDYGISCYIFTAGRIIATNNFSFPLETYLHGHWIDEYDLEILNILYQIEGIEFEILGELKDEEFTKIIDCFKNSNVVKRKYRRLFS